MQLAIELPDDLGEQLLQQGNVTQFVQEAVKKMLLEQKRLKPEAIIMAAKQGHLPVTQSFIGVLAGSNLDEGDYKKHLEDKYL
ncbi:MAG: hypothetical protein PHU14_14145 [Methylovulum sp.]|nr:hypothetical protein [Methylovulum sp.]